MINKTCRLIILNFLFLFFFSTTAFCNEIDSLKRILSTNIHDTTRVNLLNTLSKAFFNDNPDTSVTIATSSKILAERINFQTGLALALKNMGIGYYLQGKYKDAIINWQQAMNVYKLIGDKRGVANMLSNQGAVYYAQGDDAKALELHLQSLKLSEEIGDSLRILTSLNNIGGVYQNKTATYDKAREYFLRSYKLSLVVKDQYLIGTAAVNLGEFYFKMGDDSTALKYLNESVKAYEGSENLPYSLNYIGRVYTRQKEFEKAIKTHMEAFEISKKLDTRLDMTQSLVGLAQAYYAKGDITSSIEAYKQSLEYGIPLNAVAEMKDAYQGLTLAYSKKSDFANAYKYQDLLLAIKDTIYNTTTDKKLGTLQFTFDLEKKESQISLLNKDKEIQQQEINQT